MKMFVRGDKDKTGRRLLICTYCNAALQVTRTDVKSKFPETTSVGTPVLALFYFVVCPDCGKYITVKSETEN